MIESPDVMYRLLVQSVIDYAIYMLTPDGIVSNWNAGAQRAKGYRAEEIVGEHFSRFYSAAEQSAGLPQKGLEIARATGRYEAEGWRLRKDGTSFWAHVVIDAVHDDDGQLIGFAKVTRDCTEQRRLLLEQREQERHFRLLVQGVKDYAIYMLDPQGHVVNWNAGAERAKGYRAEEVVGEHFSLFYTPEDRLAGLPHQCLETARREGRFEAQGIRLRKDGTPFWTSVVIEAIKDEDGKLIGFAKITRDITERRQYENDLLQGQGTGGAPERENGLTVAVPRLGDFQYSLQRHRPGRGLAADPPGQPPGRTPVRRRAPADGRAQCARMPDPGDGRACGTIDPTLRGA